MPLCSGCNMPRRQSDSKSSSSAVIIGTRRPSRCIPHGHWKSYVSVDWCGHLRPVLWPCSRLCIIPEHARHYGTCCSHFCCYLQHVLGKLLNRSDVSLASWCMMHVRRVFTKRRSVAKNVGCFRQNLFVCLWVGLYVNTITSERVNIGWWKLGVDALHKDLGWVQIWGS